MSPDSLAPAFRNDPAVEPPYSSSQISETAFHREILAIYRSSRPETRWLYDLGRDTERVEEENWVIRWMLWHVFRYRDNRNRNRRTLSPGEEKGATDEGSGEEGVGSLGARVAVGRESDCTFPKGLDRFELSLIKRTEAVSPSPTTASSSGSGTKYWDPVRDS